jgi:hypothetical protein
MIFSKEQLFSNAQVVTANAASTNVIDLGAPGTALNAPAALKRDIGKGRPIPIRIQLVADATGTSPTLDVDLQVDSDEAFGSPKTVASAQQIAGGAAGDRVAIFYVPEGTDERFLRLNYTVTGTTPSYTITAGIVLADQTSVVPGV